MDSKYDIRFIIYAEDDCDDQEVLQAILKDLRPDIKVDCVCNGDELLALLAEQQPDLLFLDIVMPVKGGLECLVEIRKQERFQRLPIIVYSGTTNPHHVQEAYEKGANLFLIKLVSYRELSETLSATLDLDWRDPEAVKNQYHINGRYVVFA